MLSNTSERYDNDKHKPLAAAPVLRRFLGVRRRPLAHAIIRPRRIVVLVAVLAALALWWSGAFSAAPSIPSTMLSAPTEAPSPPAHIHKPAVAGVPIVDSEPSNKHPSAVKTSKNNFIGPLQPDQKPSKSKQQPQKPLSIWQTRANRVALAFKGAWSAYKRHAWGRDEFRPISRTADDWFDVPLTIVDALDTAWLMGESDIFADARDWIVAPGHLDFTHQDVEANVFELTIRVMGGLLSAFHFSNDPELLSKAVDLADRLLVAFESPTGIPYASVNLKNGRAVPAGNIGGSSSTAEITTLQLEFKYLSHVTQDPKYWNAAQQAMHCVLDMHARDGLVPIYINPDTGTFSSSEIRLGSRGDSHYEYLLKQWLITNKTEHRFLQEYRHAVRGIRRHLLGISSPNGYMYVGELPNGITVPEPSKNSSSTFERSQSFSTKMDHLVCFLPGTLALGATNGHRISNISEYNTRLDHRQRLDLDLAELLTKACVQMYLGTPTGLAPEIVFWIDGSDQEKQTKTDQKSENSFKMKRDAGSDNENITLHRRLSHVRSRSFPKSSKPSTGQRYTTNVLQYHRQSIHPDAEAPFVDALLFGDDKSTANLAPPIPYDTTNTKTTTTTNTTSSTGFVPIDFDIHPLDGHNLLRPETVESLFILYRVTGKQIYRDWAWRIFESFETWCFVPYTKSKDTITSHPTPTKPSTNTITNVNVTEYLDTHGGYAALDDVRVVPPRQRDKMDSFFLAETLKYLYLILRDDESLTDTDHDMTRKRMVSLTEYVFNTEAHPLPVFDPKTPFRVPEGDGTGDQAGDWKQGMKTWSRLFKGTSESPSSSSSSWMSWKQDTKKSGDEKSVVTGAFNRYIWLKDVKFD